MPKTEARVKLIGEDGNAFAILGRVKRAFKDAGVPADQWEQFRAEATKGDYGDLLCTVMDWCIVDDDENDDDESCAWCGASGTQWLDAESEYVCTTCMREYEEQPQ